MSKLDEKKEYITTLRVYLGFILVIVFFIRINKTLHKEIRKLRGL